MSPETLEAALSDDVAAQAMAGRIAEVLTSPTWALLSWRYHPVLKDAAKSPEEARLLVQATARLLSFEEEEAPDVSAFNEALAPLYQRYLAERAISAMSRSLPSLMLWLSNPENDIFVRSDLFARVRRTLTGRTAPLSEGLITTEDYQQDPRTRRRPARSLDRRGT